MCSEQNPTTFRPKARILPQCQAVPTAPSTLRETGAAIKCEGCVKWSTRSARSEHSRKRQQTTKGRPERGRFVDGTPHLPVSAVAVANYPASKDAHAAAGPRAPSPQPGLAPDYGQLSQAVVVYTCPSLNWVRARPHDTATLRH